MNTPIATQRLLSSLTIRLTHSAYKHLIYFSTPLLPGMGIDAEMAESRRHHRMCKCVHCNHWFWPSFLEHCRIPGHDVDWLSVTKSQLCKNALERYDDLVPEKCGGIPTSHEYREWICENPDSGHIARWMGCLAVRCPFYNQTSLSG